MKEQKSKLDKAQDEVKNKKKKKKDLERESKELACLNRALIEPY